jgi:hypothetical protein
MIRSNRRGQLAGWLVGLLFCAAGAAFASACGAFDSLLTVEAPSQVNGDNLNDPSFANVLVISAVADFECAFGGYIVAAGSLGDEFATTSLEAAYRAVDRRNIGAEGGVLVDRNCNTNNINPGIYTPLQTARFQGDDVARKLEGWTDAQVTNRQELLATAYAYAGYAVVLLGESYCSIAIDRGPELHRQAVFAEAETRFTKAIAAAQSAGNDQLRQFALLGRARARLDLAEDGGTISDPGKLADAAADAALVQPGFVRTATFDIAPTRRNNNIFNTNNVAEEVTVEDDFRDLLTQGVPDPRVPVVDAGRNAKGDHTTPLWVQTKYSGLDAPIPIARWAEAQLIIAETNVATGALTAAVAVINGLRSLTNPRVPDYPGGTAADVRRTVIEERARELFLEGQHLGDKLRYGLPFTPPPGAPFPLGGAYGNTTCLPLPDQERNNNPNF